MFLAFQPWGVPLNSVKPFNTPQASNQEAAPHQIRCLPGHPLRCSSTWQ
jgi:hypothetical protein